MNHTDETPPSTPTPPASPHSCWCCGSRDQPNQILCIAWRTFAHHPPTPYAVYHKMDPRFGSLYWIDRSIIDDYIDCISYHAKALKFTSANIHEAMETVNILGEYYDSNDKPQKPTKEQFDNLRAVVASGEELIKSASKT